MTIIQYLEDHDYLVRVVASEYGCTVHFPAQKMFNNESEKQSVDFVIDWDGDEVMTDMLEMTYTHTPPHYLIRSFVLHSISTFCNAVEYAPELVVFEVDGERVEQDEWLEYCFGDKMSLEDYENALRVTQVVQEATQDNWDDKYTQLAEESGVLEGYQFMKEVLGA